MSHSGKMLSGLYCLIVWILHVKYFLVSRFVEPAIEVRSGIVGHIKLTIPVSRLRSEPWTLLLEKVTIVLGAQKFSQYDEEADDQVRLETKLAALDGIESDWRATQDCDSEQGYYTVTSSWLSYGSSYIGNIVENLQLDIKDVHIRYGFLIWETMIYILIVCSVSGMRMM